MGQSKYESTIEVPSMNPPRSYRVRVVFDEQERVRVIRRGEGVVIGSGADSNLSVSDPTVSARHCKLSLVREGLQVRDLDSKNGVYVAAHRVESFLFTGRKGSFTIGNSRVVVESMAASCAGVEMGLLGTSDAIGRVRDRIKQFAPLSRPVLITGESGTGKDVVARALHTQSGRTGAYFPLNVAALAENLLDGELFGHERGAFTGAVGARRGMFELAEGGTLFLDEIAEMSASGQAKLLRVVEDGQVRAVGAESARTVNVRLISATCAPLREEIERGRFRHDLFHRLSPLEIHLPPLRERREDIPILARFFLSQISGEVGEKVLLPSTEDRLKGLPWHGNVRELFGALYRAAALSEADALDPSYFSTPSPRGICKPKLLPERALELMDVHGSVSAAARAAGVPRTTFRGVLRRRREH
jgi:DNA-binding NtrC family response regulator